MAQLKQAVIKTLIYSDIFNYSLTAEEIWKYLYASQQCSRKMVDVELAKRSAIIVHKKGMFTLHGKEKNIDRRLAREKITQKKLEQAKKIAQVLSIIPTLRFIGISGSVAMMNAEENDDIDLFFITEKKTVWVSRLLVYAMLAMLGKRRRRNTKYIADMICPNMFLDTNSLSFDSSRRNLYTAHEIAQVYPVVVFSDTYNEFLKRNRWVAEFLPNWKPYDIPSLALSRCKIVCSRLLAWLEGPLRWMQVFYLQRHKTSETTTPSVIAFHPNNTDMRVLQLFEKECKTYDV